LFIFVHLFPNSMCFENNIISSFSDHISFEILGHKWFKYLSLHCFPFLLCCLNLRLKWLEINAQLFIPYLFTKVFKCSSSDKSQYFLLIGSVIRVVEVWHIYSEFGRMWNICFIYAPKFQMIYGQKRRKLYYSQSTWNLEINGQK